jgi:hypothetical protein
LEVDTSVGGASLKPMQGTVSLSDIEVSNPAGYDSAHAFSFGEVSVEADIKSFTGGGTPTVNLIRISNPHIVLERKLRSSNLRDIINSAQRLAGESPEEAPADEPDAASNPIIIKRVVIEGSTVSIALPATGGQTANVQVPDIVLDDIGGGEPVMPAQAAVEILSALLTSITQAGSDVLGSVEDLAGQTREDLESTADEMRGQLEGTTEGVGDAVRGIGDSVGGLLNRNRSDDDN